MTKQPLFFYLAMAVLAPLLTTSTTSSATASTETDRSSAVRPELSGEASHTCSKNFCVHWTHEGADRIPRRDRDASEVPDYAEIILRTAEKSRADYKDHGFAAPLRDGAVQTTGPNEKIDIYISSSLRKKERAGEANALSDDFHNGSPGVVIIDNGFRWGVTTESRGVVVSEIDEIHYVLSHEVFHLVQLADGWDGSEWERESQADWASSLVYPRAAQFKTMKEAWEKHSPFRSPHSHGFADPYGYATFFAFVTSHYGQHSVRRMMKLGGFEPWAEEQDGGMSRVWANYSLANLTPTKTYGVLGDNLPNVPRTGARFDGITRGYELSALSSKSFKWQGSSQARRVNLSVSIPEEQLQLLELFGTTPSPWRAIVTVVNADGSIRKREWHKINQDGTVLSVNAVKREKVLLTLVSDSNPCEGKCLTVKFD